MRLGSRSSLAAGLLLISPVRAIEVSQLPNRNAAGFLRFREEDSGLYTRPGIYSDQAGLLGSLYTESASEDSSSSALAYPDIIEAVFEQPLDHFDGTTTVTFEQHYWYSLRHYKPPSKRPKGEPVPIVVLDSGEASGRGRLPYLDHGILDIITSAVGGIGVVLEHRYYGQSQPNRSDLGPGQGWGVDELQWLDNRQALADSARFAREWQVPGVNEDIRAPHAPFISYGGSYPGARSAHLRVLYPDLFFGAFASSAVVAAMEEFPQYFYPVARGLNQTAIQAIQSAVKAMDIILAPEPEKGRLQTNRDTNRTEALLELAGLKGLSEPADFAQLVSFPLGEYQSSNWDKNISNPDLDAFMHWMANSAPSSAIDPLKSKAKSLGIEGILPDEAYRLISWLRRTIIDPCTGNHKHTPNECFGTGDYTDFINEPDLGSGKAWTWQVCQTWGYFQVAPRLPSSQHNRDSHPGNPFPQSGPQLISSLVDLEYASEVCRKGFPASHKTGRKVNARPDVAAVNRLGNFTIDLPRLGFIDGQYDPWRPATVHSEEFAGGGARPHSLERPFLLIANGTHHWDENGLRKGSHASEPGQVAAVHGEMVKSVQFWLQQWRDGKRGLQGSSDRGTA